MLHISNSLKKKAKSKLVSLDQVKEKGNRVSTAAMQISQGLSYLSTVNNVGRLIFCVRKENRSCPAAMAAVLLLILMDESQGPDSNRNGIALQAIA